MSKKRILIFVILVSLILFCSCKLKDVNNRNDTQKPSEEENVVAEMEDETIAETDYSDLHEFLKMYEKLVSGSNLDRSVPVFFTIGILDEYDRDESYMNDEQIFIMPYEKTKEIASLFFVKELIEEENDYTYGSYYEKYKDIILEPFDIYHSGEEISLLYGRFIYDEEGNRHWLYPVRYTVVPYILTEEEIPSIFSDVFKEGEQRYRIRNVENIVDLEYAKEIYSDNGYDDLFVQKSYEIGSADDIIEMSNRVNSQIYNELNARYTLTQNIDMKDVEFVPIGKTKDYINIMDIRNPNFAGFTGTFEGNGFTISNLNYDRIFWILFYFRQGRIC